MRRFKQGCDVCDVSPGFGIPPYSVPMRRVHCFVLINQFPPSQFIHLLFYFKIMFSDDHDHDSDSAEPLSAPPPYTPPPETTTTPPSPAEKDNNGVSSSAQATPVVCAVQRAAIATVTSMPSVNDSMVSENPLAANSKKL